MSYLVCQEPAEGFLKDEEVTFTNHLLQYSSTSQEVPSVLSRTPWGSLAKGLHKLCQQLPDCCATLTNGEVGSLNLQQHSQVSHHLEPGGGCSTVLILYKANRWLDHCKAL